MTSFVCIKNVKLTLSNHGSRVAQWKRAGPITQRSEDQNLALLGKIFFLSNFSFDIFEATFPCLFVKHRFD